MPEPSKPKPSKSTEPNYQQLREELDSVMAELQHEDLDVDKALEYYQRGLELIQKLEKHLSGAENKIQEIKGKFDIR
jgi:exodeoxyribonuclease VII small subunit